MGTGLKSNNDIQTAIGDLMAIRRSIVSFENRQDGSVKTTSLQVNRFLQYVSLGLCLIFLSLEVFDFYPISHTLMNSSGAVAHTTIMGAIAAVLILCTLLMYCAVRRAAKEQNDDLNSYIKRNFIYLQNLNHISDLTIKFMVLSALMFAGKPEWLAPFLFFFTGDYLLQGRFFTLSIRQSQIFAVFAFAAGFAQIYFNNWLVAWPLAGFAIVNAVSLYNLIRQRGEAVE